jgi:glycosyltransferase involved in cell wall biosynthesis
MNPFAVSVIIPVHNCEKYLGEAIESVLTQSYPPCEVIVVDDGSTDGSTAVARRFGVVCHSFHLNQGHGAARNRGAQLAKGDVLAFLDADDVWTPFKLDKQVSALASEPAVEGVFGHAQQFHSPDLTETLKAKIHCPEEIVPGYVPGSFLVKRDAFFRVGTFDVGFVLGEFVDWYLRARDSGLKSRMLPDLVLRRRLHENNLGRRKRDFRQDYVSAIKASLDRRRQTGEEGIQ